MKYGGLGNTYTCSECGRRIVRCGNCEEYNVGASPSFPCFEPCRRCDGKGGTIVNCVHGYTNAHTYLTSCTACDGTGVARVINCVHNIENAHLYCSHYNNTTLTSHSYCSHGYTTPH